MPDVARRVIKRVGCGLLDLLFPDECRLCDQPLHEISRIPVCSRCLKQPEALHADFFCRTCRTPFLNRYPLDETGQCSLCRLGLNGFDDVYSAGAYEGNLRKLIHLFKFDGVQPLARPLGNFLAQVLPREQRFDAIVPMPLHWRRRWQRGFNQSELLAREIGRRWNVPVRDLVRRKKMTSPQAGLTSAQRRKNVQGAFEVKRTRLDGVSILLLDDVLTTGATASACARALKRAGASRVSLLVLARRDRRAGVEVQSDSSLAAAAGGS